MNLKAWRDIRGYSARKMTEMLGGALVERSFTRLENGETLCDADMVERIERITDGEVTAKDLYETRLIWLRRNRPEKFTMEVCPPSIVEVQP